MIKPKPLIMKQIYFLFFLLISFSVSFQSEAQRKNKSTSTQLPDSVFSGLKLRNIGPAFMSGRIADVAIHPNNENTWYVAVGSGGVWKTVNAGTTWTPVFDEEASYSIGCVTVDPINPHIVWVGTGENVGGRHMGYGDGIYKSEDGGNSWTNMGLKTSEHISEIIIHPENSDVIFVASQGPLWTKGGERGFYKSTDGGKSWKRTLGNNEWTGVTDIAIDPRNPDLMYAATWDRHRTVAAYMSGGPGTGLYRSNDSGETWTELTAGLPKSNMGKIGLAVSPINPDVIYAAIELDRRSGGVYKSTDRGATWKKQSDAVAGATGPHYYQELYASPHYYDMLYLVDNHMQYSTDGGKTFQRLNNAHKHGDNHSVAFKPSDPDYLLVGTDGGLYESFDLGDNWRYMQNLPVTQFYKLAVDDAEPFYNIYGGTQDNSTEGGPSRTDNVQGIQNSDWRVVLNWDGHQPATEPGNPDILYGERQEGNLSRIDMITGEVIDIQPQPGKDEPHERFNWDAPILVSPHSPTTLFFASYRVWKSDNRGDSWTAISGDLTKNQNRIELPIMGRKQSYDNAWDFLAMSNYNTITSLAQSPQNETVIYAGTDDGLIQVTENGGDSWRKIEVGSINGIPSTAFVNDIKADMFDESTVYVALDNHKYGDYKPYLVKSTDKGRSWSSIRGDLPDRTLVWRVVQDHVKKELMFAATEFGIYFTLDAGNQWIKLAGSPTIFRDLAIQKRENDLVGASFGRGFFVLDDYAPLREIDTEALDKDGELFSTRKAWWYIPRSHLSFDEEKGSQGASHYVAPNPAFGAVFTYYLKEDLKTTEEKRQEREKSLNKSKSNIPFPGYEALSDEKHELSPKIWLVVKDSDGNVIRRVEGKTEAGIHRTAWDLRYPAPDMVSDDMDDEAEGFLAAPGTYSVTLVKVEKGKASLLAGPRNFEVVPLREGALEGAPHSEVSAFLRRYESAVSYHSELMEEFEELKETNKAIGVAVKRSQAEPGDLDKQYFQINNKMRDLNTAINGNMAKVEIGEKTMPNLADRMFDVYRGISNSTYGPTETHKKVMSIIEEELELRSQQVEALDSEIDAFLEKMKEEGAPPIED